MRLDEVTIRDHRSVWDRALELRLAPAVTALVGPNLAGKSNLARAIALALDPTLPFDLERERPRARPDAVPEITLRFQARTHGRPEHVDVTVSWPRGQRVEEVRPGGDHDLPRGPGRVVVAWTTDTPADVLRRELPLLAEEDPEALAEDLLLTVRRVLPEVARIVVDPVAGTVRVEDHLGFALPDPALRATFAAATAAHLVRRGEDLAAVIVEEPEVFLHPAAQESIRDEFVEVGIAAEAPVVMTTESPFMVPRTAESKVVAVARDEHGRTQVVGAAPGDAAHATLLGGLFRDPGLAAVLDRTMTIPEAAAGVVVVEGGTDAAYLELAARVLGREALLGRLAITPAGGALPAALEAIVLRAETDTPVFVLLDNDDAGRRAKSTLVDRFGFVNRREVATYAEVIPDHPQGAEAEDVFDWRLVQRFVDQRGDRMIRGKRILRADEWHFDLTSSAKSAFVGWLERHATPADLGRWGAVLDLLEDRVVNGGRGGGT